MAFSERSLDDYVDVATRVADFREKYPEGTLRPLNPSEPYRLVQAEGFDKDGSVTTQTFLIYVAAAYRHPLDPAPGVGMAWEIFPGRTPYTRGSELQNAETSAWGRAIIAVGASDSKAGIASREEVRNRRAERENTVTYELCSGCGHAKNIHVASQTAPGCNFEPFCPCELSWNADGSLSRSRTTDEQKAAAGVMTDAEQRAHNALRRQGAPRPQDVHTSSTSDPQWYDAPAPLADLANPEDRHGTATADQIRSLQAAFAAKGIKDRSEKIMFLKDRFGPIESSKDLSYTQAAAALQELAR